MKVTLPVSIMNISESVPNDRGKAVQFRWEQRSAVTLIVKICHCAHKSLLEMIRVVLCHIEDQSKRESGKTAKSELGTVQYVSIIAVRTLVFALLNYLISVSS